MRVHLAFCPALVPRPPLGIATLKGYVEGHSHHRVTCFDLNQAWHWQSMKAGDDPLWSAMAQAVAFFEQGGPDFFQQVPYNAQAAAYYQAALQVHQILVRQARQWLQEDSTPAWITAMADQLLAGQPDLVGFSVCYPTQAAFTQVLARAVRRLAPHLPLVFGGSLTTDDGHCQDFLQYGDYLVTHEGEQPLLMLLHALECGQGVAAVPNLTWREQGERRQNPPGPCLRLTGLPLPDFGDLPIHHYGTPVPVIPILTSRGCFWRRCSFCVHHEIYAESYRVAPVNRVVEEMAAWVARGVTCFTFADEMMPAKRYQQISLEILDRGLTVWWFGLARPTRHFNGQTFADMQAAGCRLLLWGVESGCQRTLDLIDKGTTTTDIARVLALSAAAGIRNYLFMMVGFPSESRQEFGETLRFLYDNRASIHNIMSGPFKLEPHARMTLDPARFGMTDLRPDPRDQGGLLYTAMQGFQPEELASLHEQVKAAFFNRFSLFSTWFGLLREHALYYHANPRNLPTFYWQWHVPEPAGVLKADLPDG